MQWASAAMAPARPNRLDDVRYIGALNGCYALSERRDSEAENGVPVYACRLCSISPYQAALVAPVIPRVGEMVTAHFQDFGMLRTRVSRELPTGFMLDLDLDDDGREKLAAKIRWRKQNAIKLVPDKRDYPRIMPRYPRSELIMADGSRWPCFVIDISQSGAAVSAAILPGRGTPVAIGSMVGRVVRRLEVGFAVEFIEIHPPDGLEAGLSVPRA